MMISAASEIPAIAMVMVVMVFAFAFALAMDLPMKWVVPALAGFALFNGYILSAVLSVAIVSTLHGRWERILFALAEWLEATFPELRDTLDARETRWSGTERRQSERRSSENSGAKADRTDNFWGSSSHKRAESRFGRGKPKTEKTSGPSPETILGLSGNFTMKDLDTARRRLAKKFHPDLHRRASIKKQEHMTKKMRAVNTAYETLKKQMQRTARA